MPEGKGKSPPPAFLRCNIGTFIQEGGEKKGREGNDAPFSRYRMPEGSRIVEAEVRGGGGGGGGGNMGDPHDSYYYSGGGSASHRLGEKGREEGGGGGRDIIPLPS